MTQLVVKGPPGVAFKVFLPKCVRPVPLSTPGRDDAPEAAAKPYVDAEIDAGGRAEIAIPSGADQVAVIADGFKTQRVDIPASGTVEHTLER